MEIDHIGEVLQDVEVLREELARVWGLFSPEEVVLSGGKGLLEELRGDGTHCQEFGEEEGD